MTSQTGWTCYGQWRDAYGFMLLSPLEFFLIKHPLYEKNLLQQLDCKTFLVSIVFNDYSCGMGLHEV